MRNRKKGVPKFCDPGMCDDCIYAGEGDFFCDRYNVQVVSEWTPTGDYLRCITDKKGGSRHES